MSEEAPSLEELRLLRVVDLKKYLVEFQLSTSGNKPDLVQRLFDHYQEEQKKKEATGGSETTVDEPQVVFLSNFKWNVYLLLQRRLENNSDHMNIRDQWFWNCDFWQSFSSSFNNIECEKPIFWF